MLLSKGLNYKKSTALKFPCNICYKTVLPNQKAIQCYACSLWCQIKCDGTNLESYEKYDGERGDHMEMLTMYN